MNTRSVNDQVPKQQVYYAVSRSGQPGLFTHGYMVWPLYHGEDQRFLSLTQAEQAAYCRGLGFLLRE